MREETKMNWIGKMCLLKQRGENSSNHRLTCLYLNVSGRLEKQTILVFGWMKSFIENFPFAITFHSKTPTHSTILKLCYLPTTATSTTLAFLSYPLAPLFPVSIHPFHLHTKKFTFLSKISFSLFSVYSSLSLSLFPNSSIFQGIDTNNNFHSASHP